MSELLEQPAPPTAGGRMVSVDTAETFADLAVRLHADASVRGTVDEVVRFAVHAIGCSEAGVALAAGRRRLQLGAVTAPVVAELYECQIAGAAGPLDTAFSTRDVVLVTDTASDERWPAWAEHAHRLGLRSVMHLPLPARRPLGVLSLYSVKPHAFDRDDTEVGHILARHTAVAVANAMEEQNLRGALESRSLIGQAQGILMERYNLDADRAFAVMRRYSQDTNTKLNQIARQLIDVRTLPDQP